MARSAAVLGWAVGCDLAEVAPFVRSLRAVFPGRIILAVDRRPTLIAWLSTHGVEAVIAADRLVHWRPHPSMTRFAVFAQVLQDRPEIEEVLLADVRQVVFQTDPLSETTGDLVFFEDTRPVATAPRMTAFRLMQAMVGHTLAGGIAEARPVLADVVAGSSVAVLRFCRTMLLLGGNPGSGAGFGAGFGAGADQAACNVIARLGLAGGEIATHAGRVAVASERHRVLDGRLIDPDGRISPVVHGYHRVPAFADLVRERWSLPRTGRRGDGQGDHRGIAKAIRALHGSFLRGAADPG